MNSKKIMIISMVGLMVSLALFGGAFYMMKNAPEKEAEIKTYVYDAGEVSTNIGGNKHYFKGNITIELLNEDEVNKLTEKSFVVKDCILKVLIAQDPTTIATDAGMQSIKTELISEISKAVGVESIKNIYFTNYIVQ